MFCYRGDGWCARHRPCAGSSLVESRACGFGPSLAVYLSREQHDARVDHSGGQAGPLRPCDVRSEAAGTHTRYTVSLTDSLTRPGTAPTPPSATGRAPSDLPDRSSARDDHVLLPRRRGPGHVIEMLEKLEELLATVERRLEGWQAVRRVGPGPSALRFVTSSSFPVITSGSWRIRARTRMQRTDRTGKPSGASSKRRSASVLFRRALRRPLPSNLCVRLPPGRQPGRGRRHHGRNVPPGAREPSEVRVARRALRRLALPDRLNAISDHYRREAKQKELPPADPPQEDAIEDADRRAQVFRNVAVLPADQRRVIQLRFAEEKSIREVAEALGRSEGAVSSSSSAPCRRCGNA